MRYDQQRNLLFNTAFMAFYDDFSKPMKQKMRLLVFLLAAGLTASSFAFAFSYLVSAWDTVSNRVAPRQFSVSGEGKVAVAPDIAMVIAGVLTQAEKVGEAQSDNTKKSNAVIAFLKAQGIAEKDIKTIGYTISPQYQYFTSPPCSSFPCPPQRTAQITGYEVRHTIEIKIRDFAKTDAILDGVVVQGANEFGSVNFAVDDPERVLAEARAQAIQDAEKKARILAKTLGVRLDRTVGFFEGSDPVRAYALAGKGGFGGDGLSASQALEVAPGEQEVRSIVTITYEFR